MYYYPTNPKQLAKDYFIHEFGHFMYWKPFFENLANLINAICYQTAVGKTGGNYKIPFNKHFSFRDYRDSKPEINCILDTYCSDYCVYWFWRGAYWIEAEWGPRGLLELVGYDERDSVSGDPSGLRARAYYA